jgi:hypothetical protein
MKKLINKVQSVTRASDGNFFSEHALGIVITVVVGVILFVAVNLIFKDMVIPGIKAKVEDIFLTT